MSFSKISEILRRWPDLPPGDEAFNDRACERLRLRMHAVRAEDGTVGPADLANLVRHVLRCEAAQHGGHPRLQVPSIAPWPNRATWRAHGCLVNEAPGGRAWMIEAAEWTPGWLSDAPFTLAEEEKSRREYRPMPADPGLSEQLGFTEYLSAAQADTVRSVALALPGSVTIVALPTGSGKSMVGLAAARLGAGAGVSVVVVPTIALAYDQLHQAKQAMPEAQIDAWRSELKPPERAAIRNRIRSGTQLVVYAAPESVIGALAGVLYEAADAGLLRAFIVDEAHLVAQWGNGFRPDFQAISGLWNQLRRACPPGRAFRTVLMTATLTVESYNTLRTFFGPVEEAQTVASIFLRPEPDYFVARCASRDEQVERVLEVLRHGPRPAILYLTERKEADTWHALLQEQQWLRTDCIHGGTDGEERDAAIQRWRRNETDVMVATSAFGLGMDKADVRLVIHACVPETVDRFYQEVGRGGRDGRPSVSILLWTKKDRDIAHSLSAPAIIGDELGIERWESMRRHSAWEGEVMLANLRALRPGKMWDSEANMGWNMKTLLLLARAGALSIESRRPPIVPMEEDEDEAAYAQRLHEAMEKHWSLCPIRLHVGSELASLQYWQTVVAASRSETLSFADVNWARMNDVLSGRGDRGAILSEVYRVPAAGIEVCPDRAPAPVFPPRRLRASLSDALESVRTRNRAPLLVVTYAQEPHAQRKVLDAMSTLVKAGIRELAVPEAWRRAVEKRGFDREAPERFVILRGHTELDPPGTQGWPLPRLSVCEPSFVGQVMPVHLLTMERPLHMVFVPVGTLDPRHPNRKMGDVSPPACQRWDALENLLQL